MVLAGTLLLPTNAFAADLSKYSDFPNDWSAAALEQAIDNGLLNGSNGMIDASGLLTRAQLAAIVNRAFGASEMAFRYVAVRVALQRYGEGRADEDVHRHERRPAPG